MTEKNIIIAAKSAAEAFLGTSSTDPNRGKFRDVLPLALKAGVLPTARDFGVNNGDASSTFAGKPAELGSDTKREICAVIANTARMALTAG